MCIRDSTVATFKYDTISNNSFRNVGAAVYTLSTDVKIRDSHFISNIAEGSGGALFMQGGAVRIDNSLFGYNSGQSGFGGALYINGSFFIYNITFINNTAKVGGELFTRKLNNKVLTFHSIVFSATTQLPSVQLWKLREPATTYKSWEALLSTTAEPVRQQLLVFRDQLSSGCLLYTSPSPRDATLSRMPSSA